MLKSQKLPKSYIRILIQIFLIIFIIIGIVIVFNHTDNNNLVSVAATTNCSVSATQLTVTSQEQSLLNQVNTYRTQHGLSQLTMDPVLKEAAAWLSSDMAAHISLSHIDSLNRSPETRLTNCGYTVSVGYAEAIADGPTDPTSISTAWESDPAHEAIMLTPQYNIAGVDMETDAAGSGYWTMEFGLNSGAANSVSVTATPSATATPTIAPTASPAPSVSPTLIVPTGTPEPETSDMLINAQVEIYGVGKTGNPNPKHKTRQVIATIIGPGAQVITTGTAYLTYDGSNYFTGVIHLGKMSQGAYFIKLISPFTLQALVKPEFQNLKVNQTNNLSPVTLYQGDMNGDNVINIADYNLVLPCFQSLATCQNVSELDYNDDGVVDVRDYNLFLQSFQNQYGD
jgi:uncharacterized protein YkwD